MKVFAGLPHQDSDNFAPRWKQNMTRYLFKFVYQHNLLLIIAICLCNLTESRLYLRLEQNASTDALKISRNHREVRLYNKQLLSRLLFDKQR